MKLLEKIETRQGVVAVIGLGYVGLPLAVAFAEAGFRVIGIDIDEERVAAINRGASYISDVPSDQVATLTTAELSPDSVAHAGQNLGGRRRLPVGQPTPLLNTNRLSATTDYDALYEADAVIICVPTPLDKTKDPDMSCVISASEEIARRLHPDMLIVLESTTYPGTTQELILPLLQAETKRQRESGVSATRTEVNGNGSHQALFMGQAETLLDNQQLVVGKDFFLAFSPERIDPGRTDYTIHNTPKVIGGVTPVCSQVARALYHCAIEQVVPVSSPKVAEMVKLLENTFRAVNIALVNEVAIMCNRLGIDVWEVIEAAKTKPFGFIAFYPGPGLGGHCIPIDPQFLAWKLKTVNYNARFIQLAGEINFNMPHYVLTKVADALNDVGKPLKGARILILGVAYKANVGDLRESPALDLIHLLSEKGSHILYHDPYVSQLDVDGLKMASVALNEDILQMADCVVITTAHSFYDWDWVVKHSRLVVDTRNATQGVTMSSTRIVKL
jgi:UDP-N-acetyl-D-glucosamine dehydrogenase